MNNPDIYNMRLHESTDINSGEGPTKHIVRVAGGWVYQIGLMQPIFVPFNNEFQGYMQSSSAIDPTPEPTKGIPLRDLPELRGL